MINEAASLVAEKIAAPADIDDAMKFGANHPMGPLALADLIGIDVCVSILETMYDERRCDTYKANKLLRQLVGAGNLGRKTGRGFFEY
ncbi:MAG: 3-hydroxyacyl-CoA dehydrogenase family protein [Pseudomonadota bacterium]